MFKDILELIIIIIIISFVWKLLKRLFISTIFKKFQQKNSQNNTTVQNPQDTKINQKVHWDAETVEYEEIKEPKDQSN
jgi:hypothetical protein